jgi:thymidylate synthase (FAD)
MVTINLIRPQATIEGYRPYNEVLHNLGMAGRVCYKSEDKYDGSIESSEKFIRGIIRRGHEAVIEHESVSVRFIVDRGVSHELVRHRLASYCQESTRYVNYEDKGYQFIIPPWLNLFEGVYSYNSETQTWYHNAFRKEELSPVILWGESEARIWIKHMYDCAEAYDAVIKVWKPEQARSLLPNSTKTEVVMTANFREWRHFFKLRAASPAHPQMREVTIPLLDEFKKRFPVFFEDFE